ncbi:CMRF35-like molecule 8 isoform X1 [Polypterus senegalus]|uniref:CMRF35-like molecule 8 isoform X1 n=1 Tax=Polypterus senegalus TaxID=55291 RepID=UPI0019654A0D|nr:CMRF35-like molecule 8 isoform X1 [Polypterus senegalus]
MKLALRILSLLITGFSFVNLSPVFRAPEGGQLEFKCKYNCRHKMKNKYVCRTPCNSNSDVIIHSNKPETFTSGGRMSIFDYASECLIKITLTNASLSDAGKYYCGIDITLSLDEYIDVNIEILKDLSPTSAFTVLQSVIRRTEEVLTTRPLLSVPVGLQTTLMSTMESETEFKTEATRNGKAMVILLCALLGLTVLFLLLVTVIFRRDKKKKKQTGSRKSRIQQGSQNITMQNNQDPCLSNELADSDPENDIHTLYALLDFAR